MHRSALGLDRRPSADQIRGEILRLRTRANEKMIFRRKRALLSRGIDTRLICATYIDQFETQAMDHSFVCLFSATMKYLPMLCLVAVAMLVIAHTDALESMNDPTFQMGRRETVDDEDWSDEDVQVNRRQSSNCEPCGIRRLPCCFPNLCQHRSRQISKCLNARKG